MGQPGDFLENSVRANIQLTVDKLKASPSLSKYLDKSKIKVVGAHYDLDTGAIDIITP